MLTEKGLLRLERNAMIADRRAKGETFEAIGADYGMSRQAVHQIIQNQPYKIAEFLEVLKIEMDRQQGRLAFLTEIYSRVKPPRLRDWQEMANDQERD